MTTTDTATINDRADARAYYGVRESNPIETASYTHESVDYSDRDVELSDPRLVRIDRIRLLTEPGYPYYDVSYVYGTMDDGRHVRVDLGTHRIPRARPGRSLNGSLIELAREAGRFAKGLGMLDYGVVSLLN